MNFLINDHVKLIVAIVDRLCLDVFPTNSIQDIYFYHQIWSPSPSTLAPPIVLTPTTTLYPCLVLVFFIILVNPNYHSLNLNRHHVLVLFRVLEVSTLDFNKDSLTWKTPSFITAHCLSSPLSSPINEGRGRERQCT